LAAIQMVTARLGWMVGGHSIYSTADGTRWTAQFSAADDQIASVDFISTTTGWAVGVDSLFGTEDGGRTWIKLGEPSSPLRSVHFVSPQLGWGVIGGSHVVASAGRLIPYTGGAVAQTQDGGRTWSTIPSPASDVQSVCFSDSGQGWIGTADMSVYHSTDGGQSWSRALHWEVPNPLLGARTVIQCAEPQALWAAFMPSGAAAGHAPYIVFATQDGGLRWQAVMKEPMTLGQSLPAAPAGPGSYPPVFSVIDPYNAAFVGPSPPANSSRMAMASSGGAALELRGSTPAPEVIDVAFVNASLGWLIATTEQSHVALLATSDGGWRWSQQSAP
jgi:photosystem II stability/assembly factor-like uncharacterized protein